MDTYLAVLDQLGIRFGVYIPTLLAALAILLFGWIAALVVAGIVRGILRRTSFDERVAAWLLGRDSVEGVTVEQWVAKIVFYLILLFVLVAFFETLGLILVAETLDEFLQQIVAYVPRLIEAGFVLLLAWVVATALRILVTRMFTVAKIGKRLEDQAGIQHPKGPPLSKTLGDAVYWLVFLLFLPAILGALELQGLLGPVQGMVDKILGYLPNILAAALFLLVGWFIARIVQRISTNLLEAVGVDHLSGRVGLTPVLGKQKLSGVLGSIVHILVIIPVFIAALDALKLKAITEPASNMLSIVLAAIPAIFAAALVLVLAYIVGRVVAILVANVLENMGLNTILAKLGIAKAAGKDVVPSSLVGYLVMVGIMLFAVIEAFRLLGFAVLADLAAEFVVFAGHIIFGLVIFAIGLYLANIAATTVEATKTKHGDLLALIVRIAILVLAGAMALRQMGVANEIINIGFALVVGSVAVAVALAFGLGGRDVAAKHLDGWIRQLLGK